ncbi:MAG TPA: rhodanese-like domain-containing protein [Thermoanaerobaculia bacterium]
MQRIAVIAIASLAIAGTAGAQYKTASPTPAPTASAPAQQPVTLTQQPEPSLESAKRIERTEAIEMVKAGKAVYVDVRPKDQYEIGHIKGAINIPLGDLITHIKDLPPHKYLITYCA